MQDGAVEVKKEPLERSKALEDPEAAAEILVENPEAEKFEESISNRLSRAIIDKAAGEADEVVENRGTWYRTVCRGCTC